MDIRVGGVVPVASTTEKALSQIAGIEARLLAVRPSRSRGQGPPGTARIGGGRTARRKTRRTPASSS